MKPYPYFIVVSGERPGTDAVHSIHDTAESANRAFDQETSSGHGKCDIVKVKSERMARHLQCCMLGDGKWETMNGRLQPEIGSPCSGTCYEAEDGLIRQKIW